MATGKRLTWKRSVDGYTDCGLRKGVTDYEAICKLADYEEAEAEAEAIEDSVKVVYGRWEWIDDEECGVYRCSYCNGAVGCPTHYCSNCGAKMDLED